MCESDGCFICAGSILPNYGRLVLARTATPGWTEHMACGVCWKKVDERGEVLLYRQDEWVTVRVAVHGESMLEHRSDGRKE